MAIDIVLEPQPFEEAIKFFDNLVPITKEELAKTANVIKEEVFTIATEQKMELISGVKEALGKAIEEGISKQEFLAKLPELFDSMGVTPLNPFHAETVYRTNVNAAFNVGRHEVMTTPEALEERPFFRLDEVNDDRTRPESLLLDGSTYPASHPFWNSYWPPNHFNDRAKVDSLSQKNVDDLGFKVSKKLPKVQPAKGFDTNLALKPRKPNFKKFDKELRKEAGVE